VRGGAQTAWQSGGGSAHASLCIGYKDLLPRCATCGGRRLKKGWAEALDLQL
jgi:hypothetical protein